MINRKKFDFQLAAYLIILIVMGCVAIYTAATTTIGEYTTTQNNWWKQIIFAGLTVIGILLLLKLPMPIFELVVVPAYILNMLLLVLVLFTPAVNGSHRWFSLGGVNFQPSESAKLLTILLVAKVISKPNLRETRQILYGLGLTLLPIILILIEPDFGTTLVFSFSLLAMLVAAEVPLVYVLLLISPVISIVSSVWWGAIVIWIALLVWLLLRGRHFRLPGGVKCVVGRDARDNAALKAQRSSADVLLHTVDVPGPTALIPGAADDASITRAAGLCAAYADCGSRPAVTIRMIRGETTEEQRVAPLTKEQVLPWML